MASATAVPPGNASGDSRGLYFESGWLRPRYWHWTAGLLFFVTSLVGFGLVILAQPARYTSESLISFEPSGRSVLSGATMELLLPRYVAFATSDFVAARTATRVPRTTPEVTEAVSAGVTPTTANLTISVVAASGLQAHAIAQEVTAQVMDESTVDTAMLARVVSPAELPDQPSSPNRKQLAAAALLVSGLGCCVTAYWLGRRRADRSAAGTPGAELASAPGVPAPTVAGAGQRP